MGRNAEQRHRDAGIEATRLSGSDALKVPHSALWMAPNGHVLYDPRSEEPPDPVLVESMLARIAEGYIANKLAIDVRIDELKDGGLRHVVIDGHRRSVAIAEVVRVLRESGKLGKREEIKILIASWHGSDAEAIQYRLRANDPRLSKPDSTEVMAFRVMQLRGLGLTVKQIADGCPKGVGVSEVEALVRFKDLEPALRSKVPVGLLAAVLAAPREEQAAKLTELQANGVRTAKGATRRANGARDKADPWARRMTPKQVVAMASGLLKLRAGLRSSGQVAVADALIAGLYLAANEDVENVLSELPKPIADAIRVARLPARGTK